MLPAMKQMVATRAIDITFNEIFAEWRGKEKKSPRRYPVRERAHEIVSLRNEDMLDQPPRRQQSRTSPDHRKRWTREISNFPAWLR